jgi:hypothetical protein
VLAYRDGVNRFYVAAERAELLAAFAVPPNAFDHFVSARQAAAEREALRAKAEVYALAVQLQKASDRIDRIKAGATWKLAKFLRKIAKLLRFAGKRRRRGGKLGEPAPDPAKTALGPSADRLETRILNTLIHLRRAKSR